MVHKFGKQVLQEETRYAALYIMSDTFITIFSCTIRAATRLATAKTISNQIIDKNE